MDKNDRYRLSLLGEFKDRTTEADFLAENLGRSKTITAYLALICGSIFALFLANSYLTERGTLVFFRIAPLRLGLIIFSVLVFLAARAITKHTHLILVATAYQVALALTYLLTLKHYDSLNFFSILGLNVIILGIYLMPNKVALSQVVSLVFSVLFFISPIRKMNGLQAHEFRRIIAYHAILLAYCNVSCLWAGRSARQRFAANMELLQLSARDPLTGIYNRKKFDDSLDECIDSARRSGDPLSLVIFDVDDFKTINDQLGHLVGDNVLRVLAAAVRNVVRDTDIFARWGGDEFVILLPNTDLAEAERVVDRIRKSVKDLCPAAPDGITCSFGVARYEAGDSKESLVRKADDRLLQAKMGGKGRIVS